MPAPQSGHRSVLNSQLGAAQSRPSDFWTALDDELPSDFPATEATWGEVCLLFLLMLNSWPHESKKAPLEASIP